ncbi:B-cell receptor CD22-like [Garra rufa]|uniref:B-cell receptor CD22-like n=1 Tax=Garra rufa TaxID=137080 RepID=UPI003CCED6E1
MVHEGIHLLLFALLMGFCISSDEELIKVTEKTETATEGSCVTIPCTYEKRKGKTYTLLWFQNPNYDDESKMFKGTIVYSNTEDRPQSPGYSSRVEYITDATSLTQQHNEKDMIKCDLRITDLQKTDSGNYALRMVSPAVRAQYSFKYMSKVVNLTVTDNPCKVHIESSELQNPLQESDEFTVDCSTSDSCDFHPEWLIHTSEQKQEWTSLLSTDMTTVTEEEEGGRKVTKLKLNVTWKEDNRILSCRPAKSEDSCQIRNITLSVEHAPKETKATVSSQDVKEGDTVTLSCTSRGRPDVSFTWFKKEKLEESQQMSDLKLIYVKPEHSGEYYCEAKNKYGTEKSNIIKIDVKYGPQGVKVQPLVNINDLKEGDKLTLKCSVQKGNPAVYRFTWYKDSQSHSETSETLTISKVSAEHKGFYQCQADNKIKTATSNKLEVSVKYSPRNIKIEGATSVKVDTTLTLTCSADANPRQCRYTWKHTPGLSSFPSSLETGQQLNIEKVTIQHAGQYTCDVTNDIGTRSHTIQLDVLYPPSNLNLTMKKEVREFEVISIICTVQSFPKSHLTVTGPQGDLRNIQGKRRNSTTSANKLSFYLNVTESDAGMYACKAQNSEGEQETKKELTVHPPKTVTVSSKGEQTFGSELTLTCEAGFKPAPSSYEWKKRFNGQLKTVGHEQSLHFYFLEISDSGQYVCIAHNFIGNTESPSVEIKVKYAPNINIVHNMTVFTQWNWKLPVSLTCSADAYPPATDYKWYKQGDNTKVVSHQQSFTVWPQDPGKYYCSAANDMGKSRSEHIMLFSTAM